MKNESSSTRLTRLVEGLLAQTQEGIRDWDETLEDFVYECDTPRASVRIESIDRDDGPPYRIVIMNSSGKEVESLASSARGLTPIDSNNFAELYQLAKRRALGTEEVIADLFDELGIDAEGQESA